jgi:hypothetical protein
MRERILLGMKIGYINILSVQFWIPKIVQKKSPEETSGLFK